MLEEENENVEEVQQEQPVQEIDESKFQSAGNDSVIKVDLSNPPTIEEEPTEEPKAEAEETVVEEVKETVEEPSSELVTEETPVIEEIGEEDVAEVKEAVEEAIAESEATGKPLPENVEKLINFMEETGGDINDYVSLNKNYEEFDDSEVLAEYYNKTKPHLSGEEVNFLLEDQFSFDEEMDDPKDIRKKKIALKEQVAEAKAYLDGQKSKYYEDIKAGSKLTGEQQNAIDFFNRYNKESGEQQEKEKHLKSTFLKKTDSVFNDKFKGFEYKVGDKKYRFNVKNASEVKETQSDINNFVKRFLSEDGTMGDTKGYHKSLYTAMNADAVAQHFYEQGRSDALKDTVAKSKNVDMEPRQNHGEINAGGSKFRVLGENSSDFKFKIKNKRK
jgi:hypothetical protein